MFSSGSCDFDAKANRDTSGNRLIKAYPKESGHVCMQSARPDVFIAVSAQEGGVLIMDRGKDRDTLMLYLDDSLTMVKRANRGNQLDIKFGADDRVFMLRRADMQGLRDGRGGRDHAGTGCPGVGDGQRGKSSRLGFALRRGAALTPNNAAIRVRRTNSGPGFRGKGGPRSRPRT